MTLRTAIVTGGSKGIGFSISKKFLQAGWRVLSCARTASDELKSLQAENPSIKFHTMDVQKRDDHTKAIEEALTWSGSFNTYINCAGFSQWKKLEDYDDLFLNRIFDTNIKGVIWGCQAAAVHLSNEGTIINISSLAGKRGSAQNGAYCASKFAVNGITQSLAKELGPKNIRVNAVCPVYVKTPSVLEALEDDISPAQGKNVDCYLEEFTHQQTALKRLPTGEEVGSTCVFLASSEASAITGQCINVDCGVLPQ
ncbi:SDR family NAD(P)-dependent oxidoreductase [Kiloniella laminariae]|uniref:SDR family NAD(P)-dependent oxidoreductase n=1 Tax=Kiloniella laminariae TaxID=454162 RepID=A0ABT4LN69_9PROT|nr:SDR family oxidoreductase [Kiloniella laminariae]MCZ4282330.1 SDR family NAD(P)-dependent oxidoreductase [Kiloniella laminariae]